MHDDYGSFVGTLTLPAGANEDDITATYDKGIFTLSVGVSEAAPAEKHVTVRATNWHDYGRPRSRPSGCGAAATAQPFTTPRGTRRATLRASLAWWLVSMTASMSL